MRDGAAGDGGGPRRWREQRWLVDEAIRTSGIEWDQPRLGYTLGTVVGEQSAAEMAMLRSQIRKLADFLPAVRAAATRHERLARDAEQGERTVTAGEHWHAAAMLWSLSAWPLWRISPEVLELDEAKNRAYLSWARYATHHVERVDIEVGGHRIPAWLHLPPGHRPGGTSAPLPTVLACGGMDGAREILVRREGDGLLARGFAVLAFDGPGQGESAVHGYHVTATNWIEAGEALVAWCRGRPELDAGRLVAFGTSFGSFWTMQIAATQPSLLGCAAALPVFEPGASTIFEQASPTFKARHMFMAGLFDDEESFDRLVAGYDLRPLVARSTVPWLAVGGEADELSPVTWVYEIARWSSASSTLVVYDRARHAMTESPATVLGPSWQSIVGDWLTDRVGGAPVRAALHFVAASGAVEERRHPGAV
ncbi:MAG: alpha/beta hydrolase family protein [Acidimicrobiales bacterium]